MKKFGITLALTVLGIIGINLVFWCLSAPSTMLNILAVALVFIFAIIFNYVSQKFYGQND